MSLWDIYKAKRMGLISEESLFAISAGKKAKEYAEFNKWDEEWENGIWTSNGQKSSEANAVRSKNLIPVMEKTSYYFKFPWESVSIIIREFDVNKNCVSTQVVAHTFTVPANVHYIAFCTFAASAIKTIEPGTVCINISKTTGSPKNGDYVPYHG